MEAISENIGLAKNNGLKAILFGGLIAGALDITAACVSGWIRGGRSPLWIFQSVAGGFYGAETFNGGLRTAIIGLITHFFIATVWTAVYYLASRKLRFLVNHPIPSGVFYGIIVWCFMNLVVLPLTPLTMTYPFWSVVIGMTILIFFIGLPVAFIVRYFSK